MALPDPTNARPEPEAKTSSLDENGNGADTAARRLRRREKPSPKPKLTGKQLFWKRFWLAAQVGTVILLIAGCVVGFLIYEEIQYYSNRAAQIDLKKLDDLNVTSTFYDVNGEELGRIFVEDRIVLKPDEIPLIMRQAIMSAEDRRFYEHGAIDYWGILRALRENLGKKARVQGGSTIEQQLAKHLIGDFSRTLDRKFLEAFVAVRLEKALTKDQILNYYMNRIYFGKGYFGVGAAARGYFGKEAMKLTVPECALLAGIIRAPTSSSPRVDIVKAKWRRDATLKQMFEEGFIKHEEYVEDTRMPVRILPAKPSGLQTFVMAAAVKEMEQILSIEGTEEMPQGLQVRTNINLRLQRAIEEQMNQKLGQIEAASTPAVQPGNAPAGPAKAPMQGAALVADAATGRVMAWVGGRDFTLSQFDHISMARRESGALLQPILYTLGFDRLGLHPASMINASYLDPTVPASPADLELGNPLVDLNKRFLSIQDAMALGNRPAATRVGLQLGARNITEWLRHAGFEQARVPDDKAHVFNPDPMTLGDISSLYQALANNGLRRKLKIIQSIESRAGDILYDDTKSEPDANHAQIFNGPDAQQMTLTLQNSLRAGFARTLTRDYGFKSALAGMPGYSEGYRDAWFVGYTPRMVAGVWIGYDDSRPLGGRDVATASAVPLWGEIMRQIETRLASQTAFPVPASLSKVEIDRTTGALRGLAGMAPAPGDIFVYLKKEQVDAVSTTAAAGTAGAGQLQPPREWSDWLTTMFNEADETGLSGDDLTADDKRNNVIPALAEYKMPGLRGDILAADGSVYATTATEKNLVLSWPAADEAATDDAIVKWMRARLGDVEQAIGIKVDITDATLLTQYQTQRYQPLLVLEDATPAQVDKLHAAGLDTKGFGFQTVPLRIYPHGAELAHVLGYLSRDQQRNRGKYLGGDVIYDRYRGASGIEDVCNSQLIGKDGRFMISTTPEGYARSAAVAEPAAYGNNVRLSIDPKIQKVVETAMNLRKIDAVVMLNVHNGDVVAMASHPTYDPNIFVPGISSDEWQVLTGNTLNPLLNRSYRAQYPPGSVFKTVTSIAAMTAGVFDPNWVVHCTGYFDIGNIHMVMPEEQGDVTFLDGYTYSYNTYFMNLGLRVGRDILLDTARSFNLGSPTNIDLPGEQPGLIPDEEFTRRTHGREFGPGDVANTSIGQGDVLVTPLQMASVMEAIANGGTIYRPRLIQQVEDRHGTVVKDYPVQTLRTVTLDSKYMADLKKAMVNVIDAGTAKAVHRDDMKIAAKTGTAQVGSKQHRRQIAWLCGYLPADDPQYSFAIMVEGTFADNHDDTLTGGLLGGRDAGTIAAAIFNGIYGKKHDDSAESKAKVSPPETNAAPTEPTPPTEATATEPEADIPPAPATNNSAAATAPHPPKPDGSTEPTTP